MQEKPLTSDLLPQVDGLACTVARVFEHVAMFRRALVRPVYDGFHELVGYSCSLGF